MTMRENRIDQFTNEAGTFARQVPRVTNEEQRYNENDRGLISLAQRERSPQ
jgi:hypothetical protein